MKKTWKLSYQLYCQQYPNEIECNSLDEALSWAGALADPNWWKISDPKTGFVERHWERGKGIIVVDGKSATHWNPAYGPGKKGVGGL